MAKAPAKTSRVVKGMSVAKVKESAEHIVSKEIGRQLSAAGRQACIDISVLLVQVLEVYRVFYTEVGHMEIYLDKVKGYFAPEVWAKLTNNQRLTLEAAVVAHAKGYQTAIDRHMQLLLKNKNGLDAMGPAGQATLEARLLQLQGLGEEVAGA